MTVVDPNFYTFLSFKKSTEKIAVIVKDEGIGMDLDQIKKLGEPFFTTKKNGNGLGLMVSYKIIQNHKGKIQVQSRLNEGTTFIVIFESPKNKKQSNTK